MTTEQIVRDMAVLLALLHREEPVPLHNRWLPFRLLVAWGRLCSLPPATAQARSELQTGRRRFLHYLAVRAGEQRGGGVGEGDISRKPIQTHQDLPVIRRCLFISGKIAPGEATRISNALIAPGFH